MSTEGATVPAAVLRRLMDLLAEYAERIGELTGEVARLRQATSSLAEANQAQAAALRELRDLVAIRLPPPHPPATLPPDTRPGVLVRASHLALDAGSAAVTTTPGKLAAGVLLALLVIVLAGWLGVALPVSPFLPESPDAHP